MQWTKCIRGKHCLGRHVGQNFQDEAWSSKAVKKWFLENDLLLNPDKSEVVLVSMAEQLRKMDHIRAVNVADAVLPVSEKLESLGIILNNQLKFGDHVNSVASLKYHIRVLRY